ncbi:MAG: ornithine carbamoyltransferase [Candidatus Methanofastidiosia archaeon]
MERFGGRNFISLRDYTKEEIMFYLKTALQMKTEAKAGIVSTALAGKNLVMVFQKPSLRTRVSFQIGMKQLGGDALYLSPNEIQLGKREAVKDVAKVLSRYADGIMARVFSHNDILELAKHAEVPVINGLSDLFHPCQGLADFLTIYEKFGKFDGLKLAYVGDGNNVCHSLMHGAAKLGVEMTICCPKGYEPDKTVQKESLDEGLSLNIFNDPCKAVEGADVVYTDTWASMGQESELEKRKKVFEDFQITDDLLGYASPSCVVMHCLPAHRNVEITDEVIDGPRSIVYDQAENRLHAQKAILILNMK